MQLKNTYETLLTGKFKVLGHFADQALQSSSAYDLFRTICVYCIPSIHQEGIFSPLHEQCFQARNDYYKTYNQREKEAIKQINSTFKATQELVFSKKLHANRKIAKSLKILEKILNDQDKRCSPSYYEIAARELKDLFQLLFENGESAFVSKFVRFKAPDKPPKKTHSKPSIDKIYFAPSLDKLHRLIRKRSWENLHDLWMVWEHLWLAYWCWEKSDKYFEEQNFQGSTTQEYSTSSTPFDLYSASREMCSIRDQINGVNDSAFFTLNRFKNYFKTIMDDILFVQGDLSDESLRSFPESQKPYALELRLSNNQLQLLVEWSQGGETSCHLLHKFNEGSAQLQVLNPIFLDQTVKTIFLSEHNSGNNSVKYLERIGLEGELGKVFVQKTSTYEVTFYGTRVDLIHSKSIDQSKLLKQIGTLKFIEGSLSQLR